MLRAASVLALCVGLAGAASDDEELIPKKLAEAKAKFDDEKLKVREGVLDWLGQQETVARNAGNKKLVDQLLADREAFKKTETYPANTPKQLIARYEAARRVREASFQVAIKEYTRARLDKLAKRTEDELREFRYALSPVVRTVRDAPVRVICRNSGRGVSVESGRKEDGSSVWQWDNLDNPNHYWVVIPVDEEYFVLRNENSKTFLAAAGKDAVVITKGDPDTAKQFHWKFIPVKGEPNFYLVRNRATGRYLDVYQSAKDNGVVKHWTLHGTEGGLNQQWKFEKIEKEKKP